MSTRLWRATILSGVLLAACAPTIREVSPAQGAVIRDRAERLLADLRRFSAAGAWDSLVGLYSGAPGFRWAENGIIRYSSARELSEALKTMPPGIRMITTHRDTEIVPLAVGLASVTTLFETALADSTGASYPSSGVMTMTVGQEGRGWRILNVHASLPPFPGFRGGD